MNNTNNQWDKDLVPWENQQDMQTFIQTRQRESIFKLGKKSGT